MHTVIKITGRKTVDKLTLVYVVLDDGSEASGFDLKVGDKVEGPWFDDRINKARVRKARK